MLVKMFLDRCEAILVGVNVDIAARVRQRYKLCPQPSSKLLSSLWQHDILLALKDQSWLVNAAKLLGHVPVHQRSAHLQEAVTAG